MCNTKYKQTEIGLIPEDWVSGTLEDIALFKNGKFSPERIDAGKYSVFGSNGIIGLSDEYNSEENTIIIGRVGTYCGSIYFSKYKCWVTDNAIIGLNKTNSDFYYLLYLLYYLNLNRIKGGSGQSLLNQSTLYSIRIEYPKSKEEQKAIAKILSDLDSKIELNQQMNKTLEEIGKTLFKRWFVDFEFPNEQGKPYKSSGGEMGYCEELKKEIPKGWTFGYLGDNKLTSFTKIGTDNFDEKIYVATADIDNSDIINYNTKITFVDRPSRANMQPKENTVWFAKMKDSKKITYFDKYSTWELENIILSTGFAGLDVKENALYYVWNFILNDDFEIIKDNLCNGTTMQAINNENIQKIILLIPSEEILNKYNLVIKDIFIKISGNKRENKQLAETRDLLLPKLMSGKIRVTYGK